MIKTTITKFAYSKGARDGSVATSAIVVGGGQEVVAVAVLANAPSRPLLLQLTRVVCVLLDHRWTAARVGRDRDDGSQS
jgi:hypothetical protein